MAWIGIVHAHHSTKYCDDLPESGLRLTAWFFPKTSIYGNASVVMPIDETEKDGPHRTTGTTGSSVTETVEYFFDGAA
jgi:hypothetical protein